MDTIMEYMGVLVWAVWAGILAAGVCWLAQRYERKRRAERRRMCDEQVGMAYREACDDIVRAQRERDSACKQACDALRTAMEERAQGHPHPPS